jgi:adenosine deaminase
VTPSAIDLNLHSHLEGSIRPSTAAELAAELGLPTPPGGWEDALEMKETGTLTTFLGHVARGYPLFATPDAVRRLVSEAVEDAARDGSRYLELRFGPATHTQAMSVDEVVRAACDGVRQATRGGMEAGLVVCALRHMDEETNVAVAEAAARFAGDGVVGFDVAGDELVFASLDPLRRPFAIAAAAGLGLTAHAGEAGPALAVREAAEKLGVRRIGHASRAADDPATMRWAAAEGICLEVCPTSNVLTGAAPSYEQHPVRAFMEAGCDVVLGDDDPTTTGSRLANEARLLTDAVGLTPGQVSRMRATAVDRVFCEPSTRERLREVAPTSS